MKIVERIVLYDIYICAHRFHSQEKLFDYFFLITITLKHFIGNSDRTEPLASMQLIPFPVQGYGTSSFLRMPKGRRPIGG